MTAVGIQSDPTKAPLANPAFTGNPTAPTPAVDDSSTSIATTAFLQGQGASASPLMDGAVAAGTSKRWAHADHVHPTDTSRAPLASPTFTGNPAAPTQNPLDNSTKLATTAYADAAVAVETARAKAVEGYLPHVKNPLWGAKGGAKVFASGGGVTATSTAFTDTTNSPFVPGDTGKTLILPLSGTSGKTASYTITYVSASAVTLSGPATTTVSNGAYIYGWDDTSAIQSAITACAGRDLSFVGDSYLVTSLTPQPGSTYHGDSAAIWKIPGSNAIFYGRSTDGTTVNLGFRCYGFAFHGEGAYGAIANYVTGDLLQQDAIWLQQWADITVANCTADGFINSAFSFRDCQRVWVNGNKITNTTVVQGRNAIIFADSPTGTPTNTPLTDLFAWANKLDGILAGGIVVGNNYTAPTVPVRAHIFDNTITNTGGNFCCVGVELTPASAINVAMREVVIEGNILTNTGTNGFSSCIYIADDGGTPSSDVTQLQDILIRGNKCTSSTAGGNGVITCFSTRTLIEGNICNSLGTGSAGGPCIYVNRNDTTNSTLVDVIGNQCHQGATCTFAAIFVQNLSNGRVAGNHVWSDTGTQGTNADGIRLASGCTFVTVSENKIENAAANGVCVIAMSDCQILRNTIYNPNALNSASTSIGNGIFLGGAAPAGNKNAITGNLIYDDRGTHQMLDAVYNNNSTGTLPALLNNQMYGAKTAIINTAANFSDIAGNRTSSPNAFPAAPSQPGVPASGSALTSSDAFDALYYWSVTGGSLTAATHTRSGGSALAVGTANPIRLANGDAWTPTYTGTLTLSKYPQP